MITAKLWQVISIDLRSNLKSGAGIFIPEGHQLKENKGPTEEIRYAHLLNKVLPKEIRVIGWAPVPTPFSARFDCAQRKYHYYFPRGTLNIEVSIIIICHKFNHFHFQK